jgi:hypothetical protein
MAGEGYGYRRSVANPNVFRVTNPDGRTYHVQIAGPGTRPACTCRFFRENAQFETCKHTVFCAAEAAALDECAALGLEPGAVPA